MENSKVVKAGAGYIVGNYMLKGLSFLTIPIFSRLMSTSDYGLYNMFLAYESILYLFIGFAIHSSYKNARYRYGIKSEKNIDVKTYENYVSTTMVLLMISTVAWLIVIFFFSNKLMLILGLNKISLLMLVIYSFGTSVIICFNTHVALNYQYQSFIKIASVNAISSTLISTILICTVYSNQKYMGRIIGTAFPVIILAFYIIIGFFREAKPGNYQEFLGWGVKYSFPIIPHGISQVILSQFDRIMINKMVDSSAAGIYSFAYNIYAIVAVTANSLDNVWSSWFYEQMYNGKLDRIKKQSKVYMILMVFLSVIVMFVSPEIVRLLGRQDYWTASYSVIPIVAGGYFSFLYSIPASVEYYYAKTKLMSIGTGSAAIVNIVLNFVFINKYGYIAAAYTTLLTYLLYFIFHYLLAIKIQGFCIFSTKVMLICSVSVLVVAFAARALVIHWIVRWIFALSAGILLIIYEEKNFRFLQIIIRKTVEHRNDKTIN